MAKRSNYHGFDEAKNIVEAPKIYLTGTEAGKNTANTTDLITCFAEEEGSLTLELTNGSALPGSHVGATFAYQPGDTGKDRYLIFYDASRQELWLGGATQATWKPWKQLASVDYVQSLFKRGYSSTIKIDPGASETVSVGEIPSGYPLIIATTDSEGFTASTYFTNGTGYVRITNNSGTRASCSFDWAILAL